MNEQKKQNQELSFRKKKKKKKEEKKKGVSTMRPCSPHYWGNQMMLGQCHQATSEPMKSLIVEGEWLMLKNCYKMATCLQSYQVQ